MIIVVPGTPIAQPRHKISARGAFAAAYIPAKHPIHAYKKRIRREWESVIGNTGDCRMPVSVEITAYFPRPKNMVWKRKSMPEELHTKTPDADNVAKAVLDALTGMAWYDDSQVYRLTVSKFIVSGGQEARTVILINKYGGSPTGTPKECGPTSKAASVIPNLAFPRIRSQRTKLASKSSVIAQGSASHSKAARKKPVCRRPTRRAAL